MVLFNIMDAQVLRKGSLLLIAALFAGCQALPPPAPPPAEEPVEIVVEEPAVVTVKPEPEPEPEPVSAAPPPMPPVSIVLTNSQPAYADVARELANHFEN